MASPKPYPCTTWLQFKGLKLICCWNIVQVAVGVNGLLTVLGSVPRDGCLRRGSALWRHLATWLSTAADSLIERQGTNLNEILQHTVSSWLCGSTDCCHGNVSHYDFVVNWNIWEVKLIILCVYRTVLLNVSKTLQCLRSTGHNAKGCAC